MAGWRAMTAMATGGFRQCGPAQRRGHPPLARMRHVRQTMAIGRGEWRAESSGGANRTS
jgi:hypothetical protein